MDKILIFPGKSEKGIFTHVIDSEKAFLEKTAAEYHPKIGEYIRNAKAIKGKTQILLTALGAGEFWGCNVNGDYFPEEALSHEGADYGHKTFETMAKIYKHHVNKDPAASFGDVALSVYNPTYKRVELIVVLDNAKAPDIASKIDNGEYLDWSMGCRVPWDECSICGNRAPTVKEYCEHLRYYMGRIHPASGKQTYAINRFPRFFDISQVIIGADRIAKTLEKVASAELRFPGSAELAEKVALVSKSATIEKDIPVQDAPSSQENIEALVRAIPEIKAREPSIPTEVLNNMASTYSLPQIMSTLGLMGIVPKPQEFQRIVLVRVGKKDMADDLDQRNLCFDPSCHDQISDEHEDLLGLNSDNFQPGILKALSGMMPARSYAAPHLLKRITVIEKFASEDHVPTLPIFFDPSKKDVDARGKVGIFPILGAAAAMYALLAKKTPHYATTSLQKAIVKNPGLAAALGAATPFILNAVFGEGSSQKHSDYVEPEFEKLTRHLEGLKAKPFSKHASVTAGLGRIFAGVPAVYLGSGMLQKSKNLNPEKEEGKIIRFIRRNPDILAAAVTVDGMKSLSGGGTHRVLNQVKKLFRHGKNYAVAKGILKAGSEDSWEDMDIHNKVASLMDGALNEGVWALAFGGKNLPARLAGNFVDAAVIEASKKVLSKKKTQDRVY